MAKETLIISSDETKASFRYINTTTSEICKVTLTKEGNSIDIHIDKGSENSGRKPSLDFIYLCDDFGRRLLNLHQTWTAEEFRMLSPDWKYYTVILCLNGEISISYPDGDSGIMSFEISDRTLHQVNSKIIL